MAVKKLDVIQQYESLVDASLTKSLDWQKILICDGLSPSEVLNLALQTDFKHICQTSHATFANDLNTAAYLSDEKNRFLDFPVTTILSPSSISRENEKRLLTFEFTFNAAIQKSEILRGFDYTLRKLKVSNSVLTDAIIIADELVTNAVFNAPFVDASNSRSGLSRDMREAKMHVGKSARIFLGSDESRIVIGCKDPYGSLNVNKFFERIKRCYDTGVARNMNMTGGAGAGIGSFMIFNACDSFYVFVEQGKSTMVCCTLPLKMSSRKRDVLPKNLHYIFKK